jgi:outer membrane protein OmpA-like peptidoglycan-associated protein
MSMIREFIEKHVAKNGSGPPSRPPAAPEHNVPTADQAQVKDRLAKLIGPYKTALTANGPDVPRLHALVGAITADIAKKLFAQADKDLDELEELLNKPTVEAGKASDLLAVGEAKPGPAAAPIPGTPVPATAGAAGKTGAAPAGRAQTVEDIVGPVVLEKPPPKATSTDYFFDFDSDKLTADDIKWLDKYADAYTAAQSTTEIQVEGWASKEKDGQEAHNKGLSKKRADAVANYLKKKGVLIKEVKGSGQTDKFGADLEQNRRVVISPPPPPEPIPIPEVPEELRNIKIPDPPPEEPTGQDDGVLPPKVAKPDKEDNTEGSVVAERKVHGGDPKDPKNTVYVQLEYEVKIREEGSVFLPAFKGSISVGKDGKLGPVAEAELDVIKGKVANLNGPLEATLSLNGEIDASNLKSYEASVQAQIEGKIGKGITWNVQAKLLDKKPTGPPESPGAPPGQQGGGPEVTVGVKVPLGGGDDKKPPLGKPTKEDKQEYHRVGEIMKAYETERDNIANQLPEDVREKAKKEMDDAFDDRREFVASPQLKAVLKAKGLSGLENIMKQVVKKYEEKIRAK